MVMIKNPITVVSSGGGGPSWPQDGEYNVKVIDYDGSVIADGYFNANDVVTLPDPPTHDGLVFDEWSCSSAITNNTVTVTNDVIAGPLYHTASGKVEIDIYAPAKMAVSCSAGGTIDWGDGTVDSNSSHKYTAEGLYTIKFEKSGAISAFNINSKIIKSVRLPSTITSLNASAFSDCTALVTITIPSSITTLNSSCLYSCSSLICVVIPKNTQATPISNATFQYCRSLLYIVIPYGVTSIQSSAIYGCSALQKIIIPSTVITLSDSAIESNSALSSIVLSSGLKTINNYAFRSTIIYKITLPSSVTTIGNNVFQYCQSLTSIEIPNSVTTISSGLFYSCTNCSIFDFRNYTAVPTLTNASAFSSTTGKIVVPDSLLTSWKSASNWANLTSQIISATEWEALPYA